MERQENIENVLASLIFATLVTRKCKSMVGLSKRLKLYVDYSACPSIEYCINALIRNSTHAANLFSCHCSVERSNVIINLTIRTPTGVQMKTG